MIIIIVVIMIIIREHSHGRPLVADDFVLGSFVSGGDPVVEVERLEERLVPLKLQDLRPEPSSTVMAIAMSYKW